MIYVHCHLFSPLYNRLNVIIHIFDGYVIHIGTNFKRSPACRRVGGSSVGKNKSTEVLPIICHPPGLLKGYIPVCSPAIPTDPAGTFARGCSFRGISMRLSIPPKNGNPGANPIINTTYSTLE